MNQDELGKVLGVDISRIPLENVTILDSIEPKYKSNIPFIQKILIRVFGMKPIYKTVAAKRIVTKSDSYPSGCCSVEITLGPE